MLQVLGFLGTFAQHEERRKSTRFNDCSVGERVRKYGRPKFVLIWIQFGEFPLHPRAFDYTKIDDDWRDP